MAEVLLPTLLTWGLPVRRSRIQDPELNDELGGDYAIVS
jgi:hypothetical protein